jgi:hypothetical protein
VAGAAAVPREAPAVRRRPGPGNAATTEPGPSLELEQRFTCSESWRRDLNSQPTVRRSSIHLFRFFRPFKSPTCIYRLLLPSSTLYSIADHRSKRSQLVRRAPPSTEHAGRVHESTSASCPVFDTAQNWAQPALRRCTDPDTPTVRNTAQNRAHDLGQHRTKRPACTVAEADSGVARSTDAVKVPLQSPARSTSSRLGAAILPTITYSHIANIREIPDRRWQVSAARPPPRPQSAPVRDIPRKRRVPEGNAHLLPIRELHVSASKHHS